MDSKAPSPINFRGNPNLTETFKRWEQKFNLYMLASDKIKKPQKVQVAVLLTCLGDEGIEIYNNFQYGEIETYCETRKHTFIERHNIWTIQQNARTIDEFVTELKTKARKCEFSDQKDLMIRDRLIFGISDSRLKERLLREGKNPDLDRVIELCPAAECSKQQIQEINKEQKVDVIKTRLTQTNKFRKAQQKPKLPNYYRPSFHTRIKQTVDCKKMWTEA
ncbi:hypothetical protein MAR_012681 [Mya arenaria]|uniref:Retrotransposon gag domain-containing protein n=1 Tax=Mya arenaria TaxID=6604 RepID=A0ABY7FXR8_MYAAR|nr:hypothetical protein MAR_012681 [Mya arenaria]